MSETWTFVCATGELLPGEMRPVFDEVTGTPILVVNLDGELYALEDRCCHEDFELSAGAIDPADGSIVGVLAIDLNEGTLHFFRGHAIVLATGGYGRTYFSCTSAHICTGDGGGIARATEEMKSRLCVA